MPLELHERNGVAPVKNRRVRATKKQAPRIKAVSKLDRLKLGMTIALGVGIPLLSLAMSKLAGTLAVAEKYALAVFALYLMLAVLGVSLSHLAGSIENITRSHWLASWSLAVALDLSLVMCEMCHVYANNLGLEWVTIAVMVCVAVVSMALNVYAFLLNK